jgi:hypothetical protein
MSVEELGTVEVKGKTEPVAILGLTGFEHAKK